MRVPTPNGGNTMTRAAYLIIKEAIWLCERHAKAKGPVPVKYDPKNSNPCRECDERKTEPEQSGLQDCAPCEGRHSAHDPVFGYVPCEGCPDCLAALQPEPTTEGCDCGDPECPKKWQSEPRPERRSVQ